jgi:hypothetical protein
METDFGLGVAIIHARIDDSAFVRESVTESVGDLGQAGVESAHIIPLWDGVTVHVGVAEEDFEGAFVVNGHKRTLSRIHGLERTLACV